jgi:hypothetical protein
MNILFNDAAKIIARQAEKIDALQAENSFTKDQLALSDVSNSALQGQLSLLLASRQLNQAGEGLQHTDRSKNTLFGGPSSEKKDPVNKSTPSDTPTP